MSLVFVFSSRSPVGGNSMQVMQLWVIAAAVTAVAASSSTAKTETNQLSSAISKDDSAREYNFVYGVSDPSANSVFGHQEFSDGKSIAGSYHVRLPDGRHQTVIYQDDGSGFVADVSYDHIARHPDFNLYFESTQEPSISLSNASEMPFKEVSEEAKVKTFFPSTTTTIKPTTVKSDDYAYFISRELQPPPKKQHVTSSLIQSSTPPSTEQTTTSATVTSSLIAAVAQKTASHPPFRFSSYSSTSSAPPTETPSKKSPPKETANSIERQSRKLGDEDNGLLVSGIAVEALNKTEPRQTTQVSVAKLVTLEKNNFTQPFNNTLEKPATTSTPMPVLVGDFSDTIFREDFPQPGLSETIEGTSATTKQPETSQKPTKKIEAVRINTKETKAMTVKPGNSTVKKVTNSKPANVMNIEKKKKQEIIVKSTKPTTPKPITKSKTEKKTTTLKPIVTQVKIGSSTRWKPVENVNPPKFVTTTQLPILSKLRPTIAPTTSTALSIFELLDRFKPLSFRTPAPRIRAKRSDEKTPTAINLFKNLPGAGKENTGMTERMHISLKEIKNDPVFKNFVQAQRYRMVPVTLPSIKKAQRADSMKLVHVKHAVKHTPPYIPPPTTKPSAYAERPSKAINY